VNTRKTLLTERFLTAFNRVDAAMRKRTKQEDRTIPFAEVAIKFGKSTYFRDGDFIRLVAQLRNFLIHENRNLHEELAVPAESLVVRLERIAADLSAPEKVEKRFVGEGVATVKPDQSLKQVLQLVSGSGFSQFPVINDEKIVGLLTENGIARWLSSQVATESMVEFAEVTVGMVLAHEEQRENMILIGRLRELNEVRMLFSANALLEAAVITQSGKADQKPLGILTRWDLIESQ
jgi:predicted transcriptional regulator